MCFSAPVSFGTGLFLLTLGIAALQRTRKEATLLAAIPLLFGIQQISEGFVWYLAFDNPWRMVSTYIFLFFAFVVWPSWTPLSLYFLEHHARNKRILAFLLGIGIVVSLGLLSMLIIYGAQATPVSCHIVYTIPYIAQASGFTTWRDGLYVLLYALPTITPFFVSSLPAASFLGLLFAASCVVSWVVWHVAFTSVWCFFAAFLSMFILVYVPKRIG